MNCARACRRILFIAQRAGVAVPRPRARAPVRTGAAGARQAPPEFQAKAARYQRHGDIAQPARVADAADRRTGQPLVEVRFAPGKQIHQLRTVEPVPHATVRQRGGLREAVPRARQLAVVAAVDAVAQQGAQIQRDTALEFDGEIGNAAPRVERVGGDNGLRRADVDTGLAGSAVAGCGRVHRQRQIGVDLAEKKPRSVLAVQEQGVFAAPAEAGLAGECHFQHRRAVGEDAETVFADLRADFLGQALQAVA